MELSTGADKVTEIYLMRFFFSFYFLLLSYIHVSRQGTLVTGTGAASASGYVKVITTLRQKRDRDLAAQALQEFGDVLYSHSNVKVTT
jgi:hypothetical protein